MIDQHGKKVLKPKNFHITNTMQEHEPWTVCTGQLNARYVCACLSMSVCMRVCVWEYKWRLMQERTHEDWCTSEIQVYYNFEKGEHENENIFPLQVSKNYITKIPYFVAWQFKGNTWLHKITILVKEFYTDLTSSLQLSEPQSYKLWRMTAEQSS